VVVQLSLQQSCNITITTTKLMILTTMAKAIRKAITHDQSKDDTSLRSPPASSKRARTPEEEKGAVKKVRKDP
jgi:hypothetical protein